MPSVEGTALQAEGTGGLEAGARVHRLTRLEFGGQGGRWEVVVKSVEPIAAAQWATLSGWV